MNGQVTFATNNGDIAGGEVMLFAMCRAATDLGYQVTVVAPTRPGEVLRTARESGFHTVEMKADNRLSYMLQLRAWDADSRTGLLWCNGLVPGAATAGHRDRVLHVHQLPRDRAQRIAYALAAHGTRRVIAPSDFVSNRLSGCSTMHNWSSRVESAVRSSRDTGVVRLGFIGRHSPAKGLVVLAEALEMLDRRSPHSFDLVLAGDPRSVPSQEIRRVSAALGQVENLVHRTGWVSQAEFYSMIDLAIFPSLAPETFGLVVAEAQSARVPFVISDAGALPEVAGPGFPWIARSGDPASLAHTIERALRESTPFHLDASFDRWQREFSPDAGRRRLAAVLASVGAIPTSPG